MPELPTRSKSIPAPTWMIYGANGFTGTLIAEEAVRRGHQPRVAGRSTTAIQELAQRLHTTPFPCDLRNFAGLRAAVADCQLVLHCAGPFSETSRPMLDACLAEGAHYLDITGEIDVFSACHERTAEATGRGVCVVPGVGFDVVPTDCAAALVKEALPDASSLVLAFDAAGGPSVGTAKTSVAGIAKGGRVRLGGAMVQVPLAFKTRTFKRQGKPRLAMTIPWGDVFTAYITTGIPDIEVYMTASPATIASARRLNWLRPLMRLAMVSRFLQRQIAASVTAPSREKRARSGGYIWGEASTRDGRRATVEMETPNGYELTVTAALGVVEYLLNPARVARLGYLTPSQLMGSGYAASLPGVVLRKAP